MYFTDDVDIINSVTDFSSSSSTDQLGDNDEDRPITSASLLSMEFMGSVVAMVVLDLVIIIGNAMVIAAVFTHSKLRCTTTNKFVVSLAVADLMVGIIVLPFSSANQVAYVSTTYNIEAGHFFDPVTHRPGYWWAL